jgi:AcrR family transcriptional regulator
MSSTVDNSITALPAARRRRHDAQASREALVAAADELFDERGYDAATVREIGERAGVDAALIARYFGSKEGLYLAALQRQDAGARIPADPLRALEQMLRRSEEQGSSPVGLAMVSPTLTDEVRAQVREIVERQVVGPIAQQFAAGGAPDARLRAELLAALAAGVTLTRASGTLPTLARAPIADVVAELEPLVEALAAPPATAGPRRRRRA